jgi:decaprenyl-phosphate phosphoribosyltransferase
MQAEIVKYFAIFDKGTLQDFLQLIRVKFHLNFLFVILGALSFAKQIDISLMVSLLVMYLSFNVCLYGGIYTMNAITDYEKDAKHPLKKNRPLPSGRVRISTAIILALCLISVGLLISFFYFGKNIGFLYIAFIGINVFYSFIARNVPYLELFVNASTMPLRLLMGTFVAVDGLVPTVLMFAVFCMGIGFLSVRRIVEKDINNWAEARPALKAYQGDVMGWLQFIFLIGLLVAREFDPFIHQDFVGYSVMVAYYIIFCLGTHAFASIRSYWCQYYGY